MEDNYELDLSNGEQQVRQLMQEIPIPQQCYQQKEEMNDFQLIEMKPQRFLQKIPNALVLRDFFLNQCQFYTPPARELTMAFCKVNFLIYFNSKDVLSGSKKLLKLTHVLWVAEIPRWPELTVKRIWERSQNIPNFKLYFPNYPQNKYPQRKYLLNVTNTVSPGSIINQVLQLRQARDKQMIQDQPIRMTTEFVDLFNQFQAITNHTKKGRLNLSSKNAYDQCPLCLSLMKKGQFIKNFECNSKQFNLKQQYIEHKAHRKCVIDYQKRQLEIHNQYSCPLKCPLE